MLLELPDIGGTTTPLVLLVALIVDAVLGDMPHVFRVVPHPVAWVGRAADWLEKRLNRPRRGARTRAVRGALLVFGFAALAWALGVAVGAALDGFASGWVIEAIVVAVLLAQRSLFDHARAVARALGEGGVEAGRDAVRHIVGRDPDRLDEEGVARAAIESVAENFADGVVAPAFWYLLLGLPGLFLYKTVNTLDSMFGHRDARHAIFGIAPARFDDILNLAPARLAAWMIAFAAVFLPRGRPRGAVRTMFRDAGKHSSPNAGWPEAAMAGALGVALLGPRHYEGDRVDDPWLGEEFTAQATPAHIRRALYVFAVACFIDFA
ncbi:MAG: adenosylcobinamide-phosphate synthase CbiB, partial [Alphaproteobacteria bacterium]